MGGSNKQASNRTTSSTGNTLDGTGNRGGGGLLETGWLVTTTTTRTTLTGHQQRVSCTTYAPTTSLVELNALRQVVVRCLELHHQTGVVLRDGDLLVLDLVVERRG
jgi:hypothetical protein